MSNFHIAQTATFQSLKDCLQTNTLQPVKRKIQHSKQLTSVVMFCGSASGAYLSLIVICKAKNFYLGWMNAERSKAVYDLTEREQFDLQTFTRWFLELFLKHAEGIQRPINILQFNHIQVYKHLSKTSENDSTK